MNIFTKREKIFLQISLLLVLTGLEFPGLFNRDYELNYLIFIVIPIGIFILTDQERLSRLKGK